MRIKWTKLFDWSVCGVAHYPLSTAGRVVAYGVDVQYLHHGLKRVRFWVDPNATDAERKLVLKQANAYFDKMHAKMHRDTKTR